MPHEDYNIFLETRAEKDLDNLDHARRKRIVASLLFLKKDPRHNAKKLKGPLSVYRIRIGDWRVIYEINDNAKKILVYRIKHRSEAYR